MMTIDVKPKQGGTRKVAESKRFCNHPEHKPAGHIVRQPGTYEHTCPGCGATITFHVPLVTW
jgi:hypothetical protein